jgi:hypothetical protein
VNEENGKRGIKVEVFDAVFIGDQVDATLDIYH